MKKTLIALAVLGAVGAAHAQSNVTIYGQLKPSYDFIDTGSKDVTDMNWNNSRLGFKGQEDLGGGLKAIFQIESKIKLDQGNGTLGGRDTWAGLAGNFGSITFGTHQSAYVIESASYDFFSDSIGDYNNIMGVITNDSDGFNGRWGKSAYYKSPVMGGFQAVASYAMREQHESGTNGNAGVSGDQDVLSLMATYNNGPLKAMAGYEQQKDGTDEKIKAYKIGVGYKLPIGTQINAIYEQIDQNKKVDVKHVYVGASHPVTANIDVMANFMWAGENDDGLSDSGAKGYALGAMYKFSKRTNLMAVYAVVDNDDNGDYGIDSGYVPSGAGEKMSGFSVRLQHNF